MTLLTAEFSTCDHHSSLTVPAKSALTISAYCKSAESSRQLCKRKMGSSYVEWPRPLQGIGSGVKSVNSLNDFTPIEATLLSEGFSISQQIQDRGLSEIFQEGTKQEGTKLLKEEKSNKGEERIFTFQHLLMTGDVKFCQSCLVNIFAVWNLELI